MIASEAEELVGYFGFGSLVNRDTLRTSYLNHYPASLRGWRRHWQIRPDIQAVSEPSDIVLLSVHEDQDCTLNGAIVIDLAKNLPLVDEREAGYDRVLLSHSDLTVANDVALPESVYVYVAQKPAREDGGQGVLLQSYLDAVLMGYSNLFQEEGLDHFIETTIGFDRSIIADRHNPIYPRSVEISVREAKRFDLALKRAGVRFL